MPRYRVTYVESSLRECFIAADTRDEAIEKVRAEFENGQHHHMVDGWDDDWSAVLNAMANGKAKPCIECGR